MKARAVAPSLVPTSLPPPASRVLHSPGHPLDSATRAFFQPRFGHDFARVRVHADDEAARSARASGALAYTVGNHIVFGHGQYAPETPAGKRLLAHELTHTLQQLASTAMQAQMSRGQPNGGPDERNADATADAVMANRSPPPLTPALSTFQRQADPHLSKVAVHLTPPETADLEWQGTAPADAPGTDHFKVSTGKGYADDGDPAGTCLRTCCSDAATQCAPPWNQPGKTGACCTYVGANFWTGASLPEHNGWKWWTPIQPYYGARGIALHQHDQVTGQAIGHGCVRMDEGNAKRIHDFSRGRQTKVTIDGRAAPVDCEDARKCGASKPSLEGARGALEQPASPARVAANAPVVAGLEGAMS
jgi:hypothetical protein